MGQAKYHHYWIHLYPQVDYASRGANLLSNCQGDAQELAYVDYEVEIESTLSWWWTPYGYVVVQVE